MKRLGLIVGVIGILLFTFGVNADAGLVSWWKLDEGSGTVASDSSGNGNDGEIYGATWTDGKLGAALDFDGDDDYVEVADSASLDITQAITIEAWIEPDSMPSDGSPTARLIVSKGTSFGATTATYNLFFDEVNQRLYCYIGNGTTTGIVSYDYDPDSAWHHIAATYDGSEVKLYFDGDLKDTDSLTGLINTNNDSLWIGGDDAGRNFHGVIDNVHLYNYALSETEIKELLVAGYWKFDEDTGTVASDSSGNGNDGTIYGAIWEDGKLGAALDFDGYDDYVDCGNDTSLNVGTNNFSIAAWIKAGSSATRQQIVGKRQDYGWRFSLDEDGILDFFYSQPNTLHDSNSGDLRDNTWHHVAVSIDRSSETGIKFYVDGSASGTADATAIPDMTGSTPLMIGATWSGNEFNGVIDEVRIYNYALSETEIEELSNMGE